MDNRSYADAAVEFMTVSHLDHPDEWEDSVNYSEAGLVSGGVGALVATGSCDRDNTGSSEEDSAADENNDKAFATALAFDRISVPCGSKDIDSGTICSSNRDIISAMYVG